MGSNKTTDTELEEKAKILIDISAERDDEFLTRLIADTTVEEQAVVSKVSRSNVMVQAYDLWTYDVTTEFVLPTVKTPTSGSNTAAIHTFTMGGQDYSMPDYMAVKVK